MFNLLSILLALLFLALGLLLLTAQEFKDPTFWKFYFPPFYEKVTKTNRLVVHRKLKEKVKLVLSWYFIAASIIMLVLLLAINILI